MNYFSSVNLVDLILLSLLFIFSINGFRKGIVIEVASFLSFFIGIIGGIKFSEFAADIINSFFSWNPTVTKIIAFIIVFIVCIRITTLAAKIITKALKLAFLGLVNRILGALFGAIKGAVLISFLIFLFGNFVIQYNIIIPREYINNSILYEPLFELGEKIYSIGKGISSNYTSKDVLESI